MKTLSVPNSSVLFVKQQSSPEYSFCLLADALFAVIGEDSQLKVFSALFTDLEP
jgi:hypothetical protein